MKTVLRAFLPSLAVLSMLLFTGPASAGMVGTPKLPGGELPERKAAVELLQARMAESGMPAASAESLNLMPTADLLALASASESGSFAGNHRRFWYWATIGIFVVMWWAIADCFHHGHHHHHDCD